MDDSAADNDAATGEPATGQRGHRGLRRALTTGIVLALVGSGVNLAFALTGPDEPVERYLAALLDRDVEGALAEVLPETLEAVTSGDRPETSDFVDGDAFLDSRAMRTDWSYSSTTVTTDNDVLAYLTGFGRTITATFEVTDTEQGWKLTDPFAYVTFPVTSVTYLNIDGVTVENQTPRIADPRPVYPVFPGTHRFFDRLPDDADTGGPASPKALLVSAPDADPHFPELAEIELTGDLADLAQRRTDRLLSRCASAEKPEPKPSGGVPHDPGCPFALDAWFEIGEEAYVAETVSWRVSQPPRFEFRDHRSDYVDDALLLDGFEAVVTEPGELTVSGKAPGIGDADGTLSYRFTCDFAPEGIRSRLDAEDDFTMSAVSRNGEPMLVSPKNEDCEFSHEVS